jgi:hypothetical protein
VQFATIGSKNFIVAAEKIRAKSVWNLEHQILALQITAYSSRERHKNFV